MQRGIGKASGGQLVQVSVLPGHLLSMVALGEHFAVMLEDLPRLHRLQQLLARCCQLRCDLLTRARGFLDELLDGLDLPAECAQAGQVEFAALEGAKTLLETAVEKAQASVSSGRLRERLIEPGEFHLE